MPWPPRAIMLSAHGASSSGWPDALRSAWTTSTFVPLSAMRTVIFFSTPVNGSTGCVASIAPPVTFTATGPFSGA